MVDPVYILIRTSGRPQFFARMMETIKNQTYENIVTIVHTDDPRDEYVAGDIIIKGHKYVHGNAPYNLYNNRLLRAIPDDQGWYHFIDDDDEYASSDVIEKMVERSKKDHVNVCHVMRWNGTIWPRRWKIQRTYQTECIFMHTSHRRKSRWWQNKGGDHDYSKKLTRVLPINWIDDVLICKAQEGKGYGSRLDAGGKKVDYNYPPDKNVIVLGKLRYMKGHRSQWVMPDQFKRMKYAIAREHEIAGRVVITYPSIVIERRNE
jgi:hypothetical protein